MTVQRVAGCWIGSLWALTLGGLGGLAQGQPSLPDPAIQAGGSTQAAVSTQPPQSQKARPPRPKTDSLGTKLLLPFFLVERGNPNGTTTLFAVRNEADTPVQISLKYFRVDSPQLEQTLPGAFTAATLGPKQVKTVNIRDVPVLADDDGFARGFMVIESQSAVASLHGDYFQVTPDDAFASGDLLINIDPTSPDNALCKKFTVRYLNGGPFSGGTTFWIWLSLSAPPSPGQAITYSVYDEAGQPFAVGVSLPIATAAFTRSAASLLQIGPLTGPPFGVIEFDFDDLAGYLTVVMSASGLYSVGFGATCLDNAPF